MTGPIWCVAKKNWWSLVLAMGLTLGVIISKRFEPQWRVNSWEDVFWMPFLTETKWASPGYFRAQKISSFLWIYKRKWRFSKFAFCVLNGLPSISHYFQTRNRTELGLHSNCTAWVYIQTVSIFFIWLFYWKHYETTLTIPFLFSPLLDRKGGKRGTFEKKNKFTATTLATVIQETLKIGQKYSTVLRVRERVSERAS